MVEGSEDEAAERDPTLHSPSDGEDKSPSDGEDKSPPDGDEQGSAQSPSDWVGLLSIVLLSITAIVTAWTGFQASKWGGAMSISFTQAGAARLEASDLTAEADRWRSLQVNSFSEWLVAESEGDQERMDIISSRFQEPLKSAFPAWLATKPFKNPDATPSPFQMPQYRTELSDQAAATSVKADALFAEGLENNQRGDNYTILAVMGAVVLFFTAMSTRVKDKLLQWILLGTALAIFAGIVTLLLFYPVLV